MRSFLLSFSFLIFSTNLFAKGDLATLSQWMQGAFNSQKQAEADKDFFNIHLYMKQAWKQQSDGIWLYVEQAAEGYLDKPYRQRVYHLTQLPDGRFSSKVYSFDNALSYAGDWKKKSPLETMTAPVSRTIESESTSATVSPVSTPLRATAAPTVATVASSTRKMSEST